MSGPETDYRRALFWTFLATLASSSAYAAVRFSGAASEMFSGVFSGAVIGGLLLLYEQFREERRLENELDRDRRLQRSLRTDKIVEELAFRTAYDLTTAVRAYVDDLPMAYATGQNAESWKHMRGPLYSVRFLKNQVRDEELDAEYLALTQTLATLQARTFEVDRRDFAGNVEAAALASRRETEDQRKNVVAALDDLLRRAGRLLDG